MESDAIMDSDDRSYGTNSTRSLSAGLSPSPSMARFGHIASTGSLSSLILPPNSLLLPLQKPRSDSVSSNSTSRLGWKMGRGESLDDDSGDDSEQDVDAARLKKAAHEAGIRAFGIAAVDIWLLQNGRFVHAEGGLWVNPIFRRRHPSDALERIMNSRHPQYATPVPQVPGAGLAGYFWSLGWETTRNKLIWRDLKAITSDPLQPPYKRMSVLEEAGFGKATGIPFDILGHQGVVVYLARESASDLMLNEPSNMTYLRFAAQHIGTASAMARPRQEVESTKEIRVSKTCRRVVAKMNTVSAFVSLRRSVSDRSLSSLGSYAVSPVPGQPAFRPEKSLRFFMSSKAKIAKQRLYEAAMKARSLVKKRIQSVVDKSYGGNLKPPPPPPLSNAVWTFCGSFLTLQALYYMSFLLRNLTGDGIVMAPFGALLTLQFSLTAAPASQPRSILYGQLICLSIALFAKTFLDWSPFLVVPLATALAISVMRKLSCDHPPAAAGIIALFSEPDFSIITVVFLLLGNVVAVVMAVLVNNLSEKRQYPVYWEFGVHEAVERLSEYLHYILPQYERADESLDFQEYMSLKVTSSKSSSRKAVSTFKENKGPIEV